MESRKLGALLPQKQESSSDGTKSGMELAVRQVLLKTIETFHSALVSRVVDSDEMWAIFKNSIFRAAWDPLRAIKPVNPVFSRKYEIEVNDFYIIVDARMTNENQVVKVQKKICNVEAKYLPLSFSFMNLHSFQEDQENFYKNETLLVDPFLFTRTPITISNPTLTVKMELSTPLPPSVIRSNLRGIMYITEWCTITLLGGDSISLSLGPLMEVPLTSRQQI